MTDKKSMKTKETEKSSKVGFLQLKIEKLNMAPWNYKKFNDANLQKKLVANIKKNGQIENIIVRELEDGVFEVVNGNHRYLALQELQVKNVACYNLGKVSEAHAKRVALETNETKFATDKEKLAELLQSLTIEFADFSETNPLSEKETDNLLAMLDKQNEDLTDAATKEKPKKSQTVMSAGGDKYTTVKLELSPELSKRFNDTLARFSFLSESNEKPLEVVISFLEKYSNDEILVATGNKVKRMKAEPKK